MSKIGFILEAKEDIIDPADGSVLYKAGQEYGRYDLNNNYKLEITDIPMGVYILYEYKTLDGLVLNDTKFEIEFTQEDTTTKEYIKNIEIENKSTVFEFSKTDVTGQEELEGATLTVKDENGNIIDTWISGKDKHYIEGLEVR